MSAPRQPSNRLAGESSPYLLQHAGNPVDWHPWDETSLALAQQLDRPIFLSIGYSACHWCHVMEHESFEDPEIAAVMNSGFVNIKVDREERPDLDQIYMSAVTTMTGSGGWPMSVFLTPDRKPFFGGTYWPPTQKWGRPGFREILQAVQDAWANRRAAVLNQAEELTAALIQTVSPADQDGKLSPDMLRHAHRSLLRSADRTHGGFGSAPKFPHPMDLRVLLRTPGKGLGSEAWDVVRLTLDKMAHGGIYDHLGGGFARYSTDERWLAPHFEKMLYDNALLSGVYLEAWQAMHQADDLRVVRETLDYILREMTHPAGGFYATQDADSEGVEGKFFVWSQAEILNLLGPDDGQVFCVCFDVSAEGNWEHVNILNRPYSLDDLARRLNLDLDKLSGILARCQQRLFAARSQRIPPGRDEKILAGWNGLMLASMAQAAAILGEPRYLAAAHAAAKFLWSRMVAYPDTADLSRGALVRLWHGWKDGRARFNGYLDDYACVIDGLVELAQVSGEVEYVRQALALARTMIDQFADPVGHGFFFTSSDHEALITRSKEIHDNATPSGNSMAATALLKLAHLTGQVDLRQQAEQTLEMMSGTLTRFPSAAGQALIALDLLLGPAQEVILIDGADPSVGDEAMRQLNGRFLPRKIVWRHPADAPIPRELSALLAGKTAVRGETTLYICRNGSCQKPAVGREDILAEIAGLG